MGHAGAWVGRAENSAEQKYKALRNAGVLMVDHPAQFGDVMARELVAKGSSKPRSDNQHRGYHTWHGPRLSPAPRRTFSASPQRRTLHLPATHACDLLGQHGIRTTREPHPGKEAEAARLVSVTIDRSARRPCFLVCQTANPDSSHVGVKYFPFDFRVGPTEPDILQALQYLGIDRAPPSTVAAAERLLSSLHEIFMAHEGIAVEVKLAATSGPESLLVYAPRFIFDDAAFKSCGRHAALHALRDVSPAAIDPAELVAEADGIVYVKLGPSDPQDPEFASYSIGTLVNGAGLAMNAIDALALAPHHGRAANFLDTGGKATAETVKRSFELLLADPRVQVVFVNIFGGLTLGDMIARGILLAFRELGLEARGIPVVVRIRGTNEAEGQRILAESGLAIYAFDGFDDAAAKCVELARQRR